MQTLEDWRQWIKSYHDKSINYSLDNVKVIAQHLAVDHFPVPVIIVAGTNGKGSCIASMEELLLAHGYKVAAYVSPHMFSFTERIRINAQAITEQQLSAAMQTVHDCIVQNNYLKLSYFEFATMATLLIFKQQQPDFVLLEVGLGGRLDAVNVVANDLAVITSISLDHCAILGHTKEQIGYEKAGIIKGRIPVVYAESDMPASVVQQAQMQAASLTQFGKDYTLVQHADSWDWLGAKQHYTSIPLPNFPLTNAAAALQALSLLPKLQLNSRIIKDVFVNLHVIGRFQIETFNGKEFIFDVAHNPAAVAWLANKLIQRPSSGKTLAIVAIVATKDSPAMFAAWQCPVARWFSCEAEGMRDASSAAKLCAEIAAVQTGEAQSVASVSAALNLAHAQSVAGDRVVVFGSFHTVAEALNELYRMKMAC